MKIESLPALAMALAVATALVACSQNDSAPPAAAPAAAASVAAKQMDDDLASYRKQVQAGNDALAVTMGHDILKNYPNTPAASEVQQSLTGIEQRAKDAAEKARLSALWTYQVAPMEGGLQSTATIFTSTPAGDGKVRLVLRRHSNWGQSVFLYGNGKGFVCVNICTLAATFDGKRHPLQAYLPPTGEPAIFIKDDKGFIAALPKTKKIVIPVTLKDGNTKQDLVYEVAGYVADKWTPVKMSGKK